MYKRVLLLAVCVVTAGICGWSSENDSEEKAKLEKLQKIKEEYFKKHGKHINFELPKPKKEKQTTPIDIASVKKLNPENITEMQIFKLETSNGNIIQRYMTIPIEENFQIKAVLSLIKKAPKYEPKGRWLDLNDPDRILIIRMTNGTSHHIKYNSHLTQPFAGLDSLKLKEALNALSSDENQFAIMKVEPDGSIDTIHISTRSAHRSGISSGRHTRLAFSITAQGDLTLELTIRGDRKNTLLRDRKIITYGGAVQFKTLNNEDKYIAYLLKPSFY